MQRQLMNKKNCKKQSIVQYTILKIIQLKKLKN